MCAGFCQIFFLNFYFIFCHIAQNDTVEQTIISQPVSQDFEIYNLHLFILKNNPIQQKGMHFNLKFCQKIQFFTGRIVRLLTNLNLTALVLGSGKKNLHFSEIKRLKLDETSKTLQNLSYFWNKTTQIVLFVFNFQEHSPFW